MFKTPEDFDALESAMASKTRAEASELRSRASLRRCAGVGGLAAGVGIAIGAGCFGYSYVVGNQAIARQVADGITAALAHATINTQGTVSGVVTLADGQQVILAKGGTVDVSANSTVGLDPKSTLRVIAQVPDVTRASPAQIQPDARPSSGAAVLTNVIVFKRAAFGKGEVHTGWEFPDAAQSRPSRQFCQYRQPAAAGTETIMTIGLNGNMTLPDNPPAGVDLKAAFQSCVWWTPSQTPDRETTAPPPHVITARAKG